MFEFALYYYLKIYKTKEDINLTAVNSKIKVAEVKQLTPNTILLRLLSDDTAAFLLKLNYFNSNTIASASS